MLRIICIGITITILYNSCTTKGDDVVDDSDPRYSQWKQVKDTEGMTIFDIVCTNTYGLVAVTETGIFYQAKDDTMWQRSTFSDTVTTLAINSTNHIFAATHRKGIFVSIDDGVTWYQSGLTSAKVNSIYILKHNYVFACLDSGVVALSYDNGFNWTIKNLPVTKNVLSVTQNSKENIFVGVGGGHLYISDISGSAWDVAGDLVGTFNVLLTDKDNTMFIADWGKEIWISADGGSTCKSSGVSPPQYAYDMASDIDGNIYAAFYQSGILFSSDHGKAWDSFSNGLPEHVTVPCLALSKDDYIYAGTEGSGLYKMKQPLFGAETDY